ncbi:MAG: PQQ-dependent sugar dehydrogenase [Sphingomonas sp.]|uniref:PQQ-dependent sugar dehydrogenase n=1 Tax=Sphingomonas sp. TaxID=28214 RepID=UPI003F80C493
MIRRVLLSTALVATACSGSTGAQTNAQSATTKSGVPRNSPLEPDIRNVAATTGRANLPATPAPFTVTDIGKFDSPFAMAFLPNDQGLLVTEKKGVLKLRQPDGKMVEIAGVPEVARGGQGGLLDAAIAPTYVDSHIIYLSYAEPGAGGSALALAKAKLDLKGRKLDDLSVIWRSGSNGPGGQFGSIITFSPDGQYLFLTSGERQRFTPAQDPKQALGKILRLTLDGKAAVGNPMYEKGGVEAMTWTTGHRNPYGLVFAADGRLWEEEMGPRGGDELNLILPGKNYGWPIVSNGDNYSGQPIPDHPSRPDLEAPKLWWNPSISPGGMIYYSGNMFPEYKGSLFIAAMSTPGLVRVTLSGDTATPANFWDFGTRIRDVAQAPDGSIWLLEDGERGAGGRLMRLTPKR